MRFRILARRHSATAAKAATSAGRRWKAIVPATVAVLALSVGGYFYSHRRPKLTDKDTIVVADFSNSTGDAIFDDTLKTALNVSLRQSPFLNVLPDSEVAKTLQLMTRPAEHKTYAGGGPRALPAGGQQGLHWRSDWQSGQRICAGVEGSELPERRHAGEEQVTAASKEKVLDALGEAASKLRGELGESLATVQKFDVPLAEATTSSLEALKAYSLGQKA